jgi:hypothetical protein
LVRGPVGVLGVIALWVGFSFGANWLFFWRDDGDDFPFVYDRYNDALVAGDPAAAWGLTCRSDRQRVSLEEFEQRLEQALRPLGELESWSRLRGGPGWHGSRDNDHRLPDIVEEDGHHCVRIGNNPLGDPF